MPFNLVKGDIKKKNLLSYKEKLLGEIKYCEQRIIEAREKANKSQYNDDECSSDSDIDLPQLLNTGGRIKQLCDEQAMLKTCVQASLELKSLELLEHEINILTQPPTLEGESPITGEGTWRDVTAECCVDLVPFSINFHIFQPNRKFAALLFRGLKVCLIKGAHEIELMKSVLPNLKTPSDAVEVIKNYSTAYRSRRYTLARLADKFGAALYMEPKPSGGYLLKCSNILEVSWTLQNKWSPLAPFRHRMKFDLDYIDEQYIGTITQAHRQLSDPTVDTDERTLLLAKIITTCLEAQPLQESSDFEERETERVGKRRTTLDTEPEEPKLKKSRDSEVMAPPKSIPKKVKPKTQKNTKSDHKAQEKDENIKTRSKRPAQDENIIESAKKTKTTAKEPNDTNESETNEKNKDETVKSVASNKNSQKIVANGKSDEAKHTGKRSDGKKHGTERNSEVAAAKDVENTKMTAKAKTDNKPEMTNPKKTKNDDEPKKTANDKADIEENAQKNKKKTEIANLASKISDNNTKKSLTASNTEKPKNIADKNDKVKNVERRSVASAKTTNENIPSSAKPSLTDNKIKPKNITNPKVNDIPNKIPKVTKTTNKLTNDNEDGIKKVVKKVVEKPKVVSKAGDADKVGEENKKGSVKNVDTEKNKPKTVAAKSNIEKTNTDAGGIKKTNLITEKAKKPLNEQNTKDSKSTNIPAKTTKVLPKPKIPTISNVTNVKKLPSNTEKENTIQNMATSSKIPQKRIVASTPKAINKKMPVRSSPRNPLKPKTPLAGVSIKKTVQKTVTGIPRLTTTSKPKIT